MGPRTTGHEVIQASRFRAEALGSMLVGCFRAQRIEGFALPHGLPELASCGVFGCPAQLEVTDGVAEGPGQGVAVGGRPAELVDCPGGTAAQVQRGIQRGCSRADLGFAVRPVLNGLPQRLLSEFDCPFAKLEDRSEFEAERRTGHEEKRSGITG